MGKRLRAKPGKASGKGLQASLSRHQAVDKQNKSQKNRLEKQSKKPETKQIKENKVRQSTILKAFVPFEPQHKVLLVGEGDFSFALSIIEQKYIKPENLIITSFDSSANELKLKYPSTFEKNYESLNNYKVKILFKIDGTNLSKTLKITQKTVLKTIPSLDYILFNFPHTGKGIKDQDRNIRDHQMLVQGYFKSSMELFKMIHAASLAKKNSDLNIIDQIVPNEPKIILSVFEGEPYDSWSIKSLSKTVGLKVERSGNFQWDLFPGYHHRRTNSEQDTTKSAVERKARIYVFEKFKKNAAAKSKEDDEDDDKSD